MTNIISANKIKILLSSVLTLLLITSNNTYAAPHYTDFGGKFQGKKPNMNVFKGQIRKGNVFKRKMLPYTKTMDQRKIGTFIGIPPEPEFKPKKNYSWKVEEGEAFSVEINCLVGGTMCSARKGKAKTQIKFRGQEGQSFSRGLHNNGAFRERVNDTSISGSGQSDEVFPKVEIHMNSGGGSSGATRRRGDVVYDGSQEVIKSTGAFDIAPVGKDGALGPDVVTTLEHGPGVVNDNDSRITFPDDLGPPGIVNDSNSRMLQKQQQTLKFINGEWR